MEVAVLNQMPLPLRGKSTVRLSNNFSSRSEYLNIHSYRICMSFLAAMPLNYPSLEGHSDDEIVDFFNKNLSNDAHALRYFVDIKDILSAWGLSNPRKAKQLLKKHIVDELIVTHIRDGQGGKAPVFAQVQPHDDLIVVWMNPRAMPHLINAHLAKSGFITPMSIELLTPFRSVYTAKLFEQLVRFKDTGVLYTTPEALQELTGSKSCDFSALNRDVLKKSFKELEDNRLVTKGSCSVAATRKSGRKVTHLEIYFELSDSIGVRLGAYTNFLDSGVEC